MAQSPATEFDRVTIHLPRAIPAVDRGRWLRRATNALAGADLTPPGFPPGALLVVRRMADPAPGALWRGESWQAGDRWGQQARGALARHWQRAARPALGAVPPAAGAVWFADRAEWLACLSRDLAAGARRWWWEHWQQPLPRGDRLAALWREEARWLPAACALLHAQSAETAIACAALIPPPRLAPVRAALIAEHALPIAWQTGADSAEPFVASLLRTASAPDASEATQLVALALLIHHAPAAARSGPHAALSLAVPEPDRDQAGGVAETDHPATAVPADGASPGPRIAPAAPPEAAAPPPGSVETIAAAPAPPPAAPSGLRPHQRHPAPRADGAQPPWWRDETPGARSGTAEAAQETIASRPPEFPVIHAEEAALRTALGGVWYLLNALEALDWLDELTPAADPWLKLAAIARLLLWPAEAEDAGGASNTADNLSSDPLWDLLKAQARPDGDLAAGEATASAWARDTLPTIRGWLEHRLGQRASLSPLLAIPARIALSRTHLAIHFRLDQIDLAVRLAGLDRDPGWIPRLRRVVQFIFA